MEQSNSNLKYILQKLSVFIKQWSTTTKNSELFRTRIGGLTLRYTTKYRSYGWSPAFYRNLIACERWRRQL